MEQNEKYMSGLQAKLNALKAEFQKLVIGEGGIAKFVKFVIELGTNILKVANTDIGSFIVKSTLLYTVVFKLVKVFTDTSKGIGKFINGIKLAYRKQVALEAQTNLTTIAMIKLKAGVQAVGAVLKRNVWALAITAAITAIAKLIEGFKDSQEEAENLSDSLSQSLQSLPEISDEISEIQKKIDEINKKKLEITDEKQLNTLALESEELRKQLAYKIAIQKSEEQEAIKKAKKADKKKQDSLYSREEINSWIHPIKYATGIFKGDVTEAKQVTSEEALQEAIDKIQWYQQQIDYAKETISQATSEAEKLEAEEHIESYLSHINEIVGENEDTITTITDIIEGLSYSDDKTDKVRVEELQNLLNLFYTVSNIFGEVENEINQASENSEDAIDRFEEDKKRIEELRKEFDFSSVSIKNLTDSFDALGNAYNELNSETGLSLETYESLISLSPEYLNCLFDENGILRATADSQEELYKLKVEELAISQARKLIELAETYSKEEGNLEKLDAILKETTADKWSLIYADLASLDITDEQKLAIEKQIETYRHWAENVNIATRATKNNTKANKDNLNSLKSDYDKAFDFIKKKLSDKQKADTDDIDNQINALKELQEVEEKYWQDKIDALKDAHDELEDNIELEEALQALEEAKAKKVMVLEGNKWVYKADENAITEAQEKVHEIQRKQEYDAQLAELEDFKNKAKENYDNQIDDLNKHKDEVEKYYNDQLELLENYTSEYDDLEGQRLAKELLNIDIENDNWEKSLDNLRTYVDEYNNILRRLNTVGSNNDNGGKPTSGKKEYWLFNNVPYKTKKEAEKARNDYLAGMSTSPKRENALDLKIQHIKSYASGIASVSGNQIAITGEDPNKEIVLGSKINGVLTSIDKGGGVVNSQGTKTLAGLLNKIGGYAMNSLSNSYNTYNSESNGCNISIGNISLPSVSNGEEFVNYLQDFSAKMVQKSFAY